MIKATLKFASELVEVVWSEQGLMFFDVSSGQITTIEGLRLDKSGVIKEFPDLKDDDEWRKKAIERFKIKIKSFNTEMEIIKYCIEELKKFGWQPLTLQRGGFRPQKIE